DDARRLRALVARLDHGGHGVDSLKALVDDVNYERGYRGYPLRVLRARRAAARAGLRADRHEARPGRALRRDRLPARRGDFLLESEGCAAVCGCRRTAQIPVPLPRGFLQGDLRESESGAKG